MTEHGGKKCVAHPKQMGLPRVWANAKRRSFSSERTADTLRLSTTGCKMTHQDVSCGVNCVIAIFLAPKSLMSVAYTPYFFPSIKVPVWGSIIFHNQALWNKAITSTTLPSVLLFRNFEKSSQAVQTFQPQGETAGWTEDENSYAAWRNQTRDLPKSRSRKEINQFPLHKQNLYLCALEQLLGRWDCISATAVQPFPQNRKLAKPSRLCAVSYAEIVLKCTHWPPPPFHSQ